MKNGYPSSCLTIFQMMKNNHIKLTQSSYNVAISALFEMRQPQLVVRAIPSVMEGLCPDASTFNKLILILGKEGNVHGARLAFKHTKKAGVYPNSLTYSTLIHPYFSQSLMEEAQKVYDEMLDNGFDWRWEILLL